MPTHNCDDIALGGKVYYVVVTGGVDALDITTKHCVVKSDSIMCSVKTQCVSSGSETGNCIAISRVVINNHIVAGPADKSVCTITTC